MEAVLKHLADTAELLAVAAHSAVVQQWDKQTVTRAFHWAHYCENLFSRFHNNQAIRRIMERQLQLTNQSLAAVFPAYTDVSFSDLSRCQHLLLVGLFNNPDLPSSIIKILFDTATPFNTELTEYEDITGFCSQIIEFRSACKVLGPLTELAAVGAEAEVQGEMLMEKLSDLLNQGSEASWIDRFLDSVLQGCEGEGKHFCLVMAAALNTTNTSAQAASLDCLLRWLQKTQSLLRHMCSALPATLLIELAKKHLRFRDTYCEVLKEWASEMEYNINEGEWVQTSPEHTVSFQRLTEHFLGLFAACPGLRDDVEEVLKDKKISDGDFDVRGLSVWGDLLSALNS